MKSKSPDTSKSEPN